MYYVVVKHCASIQLCALLALCKSLFLSMRLADAIMLYALKYPDHVAIADNIVCVNRPWHIYYTWFKSLTLQEKSFLY